MRSRHRGPYRRVTVGAAVAAVAMLVLGAGCAGRVPPRHPGRGAIGAPAEQPPRPAVAPLPRASSPGGPLLRVAVRVDAERVTLGATGPETLLELEHDGQGLGRFRTVAVRAAGDRRLEIAPVGYPAHTIGDTLRCRSADTLLRIDDRTYRGGCDVLVDANGKLAVINVVPLEHYLLGVVPLEIGWPGEAAAEVVKAQAVAARTYALGHLDRWSELGFDLYGDVRDQAYGGAGAEHAGVTAAVEATTGVVATYRGEVIRAFYSSCCGGRSAPAEETWDFGALPYVVSRPDQRDGVVFCYRSKHYRWSETWTADEIAALMRAHYVEEFGGGRVPGGRLERIAIESRYGSGRVRSMAVRMGGHDYRMGGDRIRWVLRRGGPGGAILRSSSFSLQLENVDGRIAGVRAVGAGNGHGVGMCQAGAIEMARLGYTYRQILEHYYRGIRLQVLSGSKYPGAD